MKGILFLLSIIALASCGKSWYGPHQEISLEQSLLWRLEKSSRVAEKLDQDMVLTFKISHPMSRRRQKRTFFELQNQTHKYCQVTEEAQIVTNPDGSGGFGDYEIIEEQTFILTENITIEEIGSVVSIENIYDECLQTIKDTDFSLISDNSVKPGFDVRHFSLKTNNEGLLVQCGVYDYNSIAGDGATPQLYEISKLSDFDSDEEFCIE